MLRSYKLGKCQDVLRLDIDSLARLTCLVRRPSKAPVSSAAPNVRRVTVASAGGDEQQLGVVVVDSRNNLRLSSGGFQQPERNGVHSNSYTAQQRESEAFNNAK